MVLYETHHWFDFIQAATGAQFFQPDYVLQRANTLAQKARQSWMDLEINAAQAHAQRVYGYLESLENAGNALVCLTGEGEPLAERRFMLQLPHRLQAFEHPDLISDLVGLLIPDLEGLEEFWPHWFECLEGSVPGCQQRWRLRRPNCMPAASFTMSAQSRRSGRKAQPRRFGCCCAPGLWRHSTCLARARNFRNGSPRASFLAWAAPDLPGDCKCWISIWTG